MSSAVKLIAARKWYCVLRHGKGIGLLESVRFDRASDFEGRKSGLPAL